MAAGGKCLQEPLQDAEWRMRVRTIAVTWSCRKVTVGHSCAHVFKKYDVILIWNLFYMFTKLHIRKLYFFYRIGSNCGFLSQLPQPFMPQMFLINFIFQNFQFPHKVMSKRVLRIKKLFYWIQWKNSFESKMDVQQKLRIIKLNLLGIMLLRPLFVTSLFQYWTSYWHNYKN